MENGTGRVVSAILLTLCLQAIVTAEPRIKCWTNRDGVRECGQSVPPEYAQQGHSRFNAQGVEVERQGRAKSVQELHEAERIAAQEVEEKRRREEQEKANRVLLDTFSSEDDLVLARDGKISAIEAQIELTQSRIKKLQANLDQMIGAAAAMERRGQTPPEQTTADIEDVRGQIQDNRSFIAAKRDEQETVRRQFDVDIDRFRQLTAERASDGGEDERPVSATR